VNRIVLIAIVWTRHRPYTSASTSVSTALYNIMASAVHAGSSSYPPPPETYAQNSINPTMNGVHASHSALNSFDGSHSITSTPTPTPPASRHQPNMPYNAAYGHMIGGHNQQNTPRQYHDLKPNVRLQQYPPGQKPQIYTVCMPVETVLPLLMSADT